MVRASSFRASERSGDAINGRPGGVRETHGDFAEFGIRQGPHVAHDGRRATAALPRDELQTKNTAVNHARGAVVVGDTDAPFPEEMCFFTANRADAKWGATKRRMRQKCGGELPCVVDRNPYAREFQWRK